MRSSDHVTAFVKASHNMNIEGNVSYQDFEGGFWGIVSLDGKKYMPIQALPDKMQVDGLKVIAEVELVQMLGSAMWGIPVRVHSISQPE